MRTSSSPDRDKRLVCVTIEAITALGFYTASHDRITVTWNRVSRSCPMQATADPSAFARQLLRELVDSTLSAPDADARQTST
jgi:hypothetical protein